LFHLDDSEVGISKDLDTIESDLRNQYWMVYRPAELRHMAGSTKSTWDFPANQTKSPSMFVPDITLRTTEFNRLLL
jgi:hypothetical protein